MQVTVQAWLQDFSKLLFRFMYRHISPSVIGYIYIYIVFFLISQYFYFQIWYSLNCYFLILLSSSYIDILNKESLFIVPLKMPFKRQLNFKIYWYCTVYIQFPDTMAQNECGGFPEVCPRILYKRNIRIIFWGTV